MVRDVRLGPVRRRPGRIGRLARECGECGRWCHVGDGCLGGIGVRYGQLCASARVDRSGAGSSTSRPGSLSVGALSRALRRRKTGHPLSAAPYCALMLNGLTGTSSLENRLQIGASPQQSRASAGFISIFVVVRAGRFICSIRQSRSWRHAPDTIANVSAVL